MRAVNIPGSSFAPQRRTAMFHVLHQWCECSSSLTHRTGGLRAPVRMCQKPTLKNIHALYVAVLQNSNTPDFPQEYRFSEHPVPSLSLQRGVVSDATRRITDRGLAMPQATHHATEIRLPGFPSRRWGLRIRTTRSFLPTPATHPGRVTRNSRPAVTAELRFSDAC